MAELIVMLVKLLAIAFSLSHSVDAPLAEVVKYECPGINRPEKVLLGRPVLALNPAGDAVFAVRYDGFGRVAQRRAPWPTDATKQRIESYFYDGVRRIQEVFTDPVGAVPPWPQPHGGGPSATPETRTEAEYVWSAAGGQPFDTCHVQIDWWDREAWFIQDHQTGTVRAYTDPSGEIAEQYGFDAFGNLVRRDEFTLVKGGSQGYYRSFRQRLGHHGLFAERVDGHTNQRVLNAGAGAEVWYQSRSRWYAPELGRFLSSDPNATGIPVVSSLASLGQVAAGPPSGSFGWEAHYGDGWDTYTAYGANPVRATDPTGLFFLLDVGGAGAVRNTLGEMQFESGMNSMQAIAMLSAGIGANQAVMAMMADSVFGAVGSKMIAYGLDLAKGLRTSVWAKPNFERGREIERMLGANLPSNFPTIDKWSGGVATSIKSMDLSAPTYQSLSKMKSTVRGYIHSVRDFKGRIWGKTDVPGSDIRERALDLAIPPGATQSQLALLNEMALYAKSQGVTMKVIPIP